MLAVSWYVTIPTVRPRSPHAMKPYIPTTLTLTARSPTSHTRKGAHLHWLLGGRSGPIWFVETSRRHSPPGRGCDTFIHLHRPVYRGESLRVCSRMAVACLPHRSFSAFSTYACVRCTLEPKLSPWVLQARFQVFLVVVTVPDLGMQSSIRLGTCLISPPKLCGLGGVPVRIAAACNFAAIRLRFSCLFTAR